MFSSFLGRCRVAHRSPSLDLCLGLERRILSARREQAAILLEREQQCCLACATRHYVLRTPPRLSLLIFDLVYLCSHIL